MMKRIYALAAIALAAPAYAQVPQASPPPYAQITMTEVEYNQLIDYLKGQPYGVVAPIVNFLTTKETMAQGAAVKPSAPPAATPPATDAPPEAAPAK